MSKSMTALCGALVLAGSGVAGAAGIRGDYVEARTADVFTGPCFSNAEVFIYGNQAVMAWKVTEGSYRGRRPDRPERRGGRPGDDDLLRGQARAGPRRADRRREGRRPPARRRWWRWPRTLGGARLSHVVDVKIARISLKVEPHAMADADDPATPAHGMPQAPARLVLGPRPGADRDPPARRPRPLLRQRGRRLPAALARGRPSCRPTPSATSSRARA